MKRERVFASIVSAIGVLALAFGVSLAAGYMSLEGQMPIFEWVQMVSGAVISWPLIVFRPIFLSDANAISPGTPSPRAFLGMLLFDAVVYALLIYGILSWRARRK